MEVNKKSSRTRLKKSKKKTEKNESRKTVSAEIDSFIDLHGIKTETFSDGEMEQTGENLKRVLDITSMTTPKRNRTETDISESIGMPGNASITCLNPRPVSVVHKTEINQHPVFIVQKLQSAQTLGSPIVNIVSSAAVEKTLKMSPSSLSRPKTIRRPFARKILPATLKMETTDATPVAVLPVKQYCQKKKNNAKMRVKRVPLQKKIEGLTKKNLQKHLENRVNAKELSRKSTVPSDDTDLETYPVPLTNPEAIDTPNLELEQPRPVLLVQNKSFNRNKKQSYRLKNSINNQPTAYQDTGSQSLNETALTSDSDFQTDVKSIKTEPEEIQLEMSEPLWTDDQREKNGEPSCSQKEQGFDANVRKDSSSNTANCDFQFSKELSGATTSSVSAETTNVYSMQLHNSQPKSVLSKLLSMTLSGVSSAAKDTSKTIVSNTSITCPEVTVSNFSPTIVSTAISKSSVNNLRLLASKDSRIQCCIRSSKSNSELSPNNTGLSLSAPHETGRLQTNPTNFIQGTVVGTQCQSTTGMKLVTIPHKTITSTRTKSGSKNSKVLNCFPTTSASRPVAITEVVSSPFQPNNWIFPSGSKNSKVFSCHPTTSVSAQVVSRPIATSELVSSPMIRSTQPNNMMLPRFPNSSPGVRYPAPFIFPQPDANITRAANILSLSQQILSSVSDPTIILNQPSTSGATMPSQNLLISPPSLPQGPGILNNSMFDQSLGGYRLGNLIIKTQNIGTPPQTSVALPILSPSVTSNLVLSAKNQNQTIQGTSIQSITSASPTLAKNSVGTISSSTIQGTTSTGNTNSPVYSFQLPPGHGINQNQILSSPFINFPVFSQIPGAIVNPGSSQGQPMIQNPVVQTYDKQVAGSMSVTNQQVRGALPNCAIPGGNQQVPAAVPNLRVSEAMQKMRQAAFPGLKQEVPQTIPNQSVPGSIPIQSSATPQIIVISPNLANHSARRIQSHGSPVLSYPKMLQLPGNISNLVAPRTSSHQSSIPSLQTPKMVSLGSTIPNLKKSTNAIETSASNQPGILTRGPENSGENLTSSNVLFTNAVNNLAQNVDTSVKTPAVKSAANLKKNPPIADSRSQTSKLNAQAQDEPANCETSRSAIVSASESSPSGCQISAASPVIPARPGTSLKEVPLKLGAEIKPIPSDIPGPYKAYDHDVLIHVKYKYRRSRDKTRSMYIHDPIWRSMIKGYIRRELNYRHLAKQLYQMPELVKELHKLFLKQIEAECSVMCSPKTQTILRKLDPPNLDSLKFEGVLTELQKDAPLLRSVLNAVRSEKCPDQNLGIVAALLLYSRSTYLSAVHHVITKILHDSGADTKTIDVLSSMGLCSKSTSYFGNIKRYCARNNNEDYHKAFADTQQCSDVDNIDTGMDASDESVNSDEDFDIKSKLKDKILKKISPENNKLTRKRMKKRSKMKNIQSCSASKKLKISSPLKSAKMAASCDTLSVISNPQGTLSKTGNFKTAESCNESDVPLISAANDNNSAINSFCDNVEIHDGFDVDSETELNEASVIASSSKYLSAQKQ